MVVMVVMVVRTKFQRSDSRRRFEHGDAVTFDGANYVEQTFFEACPINH